MSLLFTFVKARERSLIFSGLKKSTFLKSMLLPNLALDVINTRNQKFILKIIFWWCLNRYYSMIFIRCYYLDSIKIWNKFKTFNNHRIGNFSRNIDLRKQDILSQENIWHSSIKQCSDLFQTYFIYSTKILLNMSSKSGSGRIWWSLYWMGYASHSEILFKSLKFGRSI